MSEEQKVLQFVLLFSVVNNSPFCKMFFFFNLATSLKLEYWSSSGHSYKNASAYGDDREVGVSCKQLEVKCAVSTDTFP